MPKPRIHQLYRDKSNRYLLINHINEHSLHGPSIFGRVLFDNRLWEYSADVRTFNQTWRPVDEPHIMIKLESE